jgi:hypothetical protein
MLSNVNVNRPTQGATPPAIRLVPHQCDLCGWPRMSGAWLAYRLAGRPQKLWTCDDCQRSLARQVDGEGVLGG